GGGGGGGGAGRGGGERGPGATPRGPLHGCTPTRLATEARMPDDRSDRSHTRPDDRSDRPHSRPGEYRPPPFSGPRPFRPPGRLEPAPPMVHTVRLRDGERELEVSGSAVFVRQLLDDLASLWPRLHGEGPARPAHI